MTANEIYRVNEIITVLRSKIRYHRAQLRTIKDEQEQLDKKNGTDIADGLNWGLMAYTDALGWVDEAEQQWFKGD